MRRSSPLLLALFVVAADAAPTRIDAVTVTPPADGCALLLVAGRRGADRRAAGA